MPVPNFGGKALTYDQYVEEMAKEPYGWHKEIEFPWVEYDARTKQFNVIYYLMNSDAITCKFTNECIGTNLTFVRLTPSGVMHTCAICGKTMGPLSHEDMQKVEERMNVSRSEAKEILNKTGQKIPGVELEESKQIRGRLLRPERKR